MEDFFIILTGRRILHQMKVIQWNYINIFVTLTKFFSKLQKNIISATTLGTEIMLDGS